MGGFEWLSYILRNNDKRFTIDTKTQILEHSIIHVLYYIAPRRVHLHKLQITQRNLERTVLNIRIKSKQKTIQWILEQTKMKNTEHAVMKMK